MHNIKTDIIETVLNIISKFTNSGVRLDYNFDIGEYIFDLPNNLSDTEWVSMRKLVKKEKITNVILTSHLSNIYIKIAKYKWNGVKYCIDDVYERPELKINHTYKILNSKEGDSVYIKYLKCTEQDGWITAICEQMIICEYNSYPKLFFEVDTHRCHSFNTLLEYDYEEISLDEYNDIKSKYKELYSEITNRELKILELRMSGKDFIIID